MPEERLGRPATLGDDMRAVAVTRILHGAMEALANLGLGATVDEVAAAAGVSRRTVFRHFPTQAQLFVAAIEAVKEIYDANLPESTDAQEPIEEWLRLIASRYHELNARYVGRAFWDVYIERPGVAEPVLEAINDVARARYEYAKRVATSTWHKAGGTGRPPAWVVDAFSLHLSAFATFAFPRHSPDKAGQVCSRVLCAVLDAAVGTTAPSA